MIDKTKTTQSKIKPSMRSSFLSHVISTESLSILLIPLTAESVKRLLSETNEEELTCYVDNLHERSLRLHKQGR